MNEMNEITKTILDDASNKEIINGSAIIKEEIETQLPPQKINNDLLVGGIDELISALPEMDFFHLRRLERDVNIEIKNLNDANNMIESLSKMSFGDDINRQIALDNVLHDNAYKEDIEMFKQVYPENLNRLMTMKNAVLEELKRFDGQEQGTKFMTDQMIIILKKDLEKLQAVNAPKKEIDLVQITLDAYENRTNIDFIKGKAQKKYIISGLRRDLWESIGKCVEFTEREFSVEFNKAQLLTLEKYINDIFENDAKAADLFIYHLAKIIRAERHSGYYNYIKALVLNVLDIKAGIYDLEGGEEAFNDKLHDLYQFYK